jgi:hypothetical protein
MNAQRVDAIVQLIQTLSDSEQAMVRQRLMDNRTAPILQPEVLQQSGDRPAWMAALHPWTLALVGVISPERHDFTSTLAELDRHQVGCQR